MTVCDITKALWISHK